MLKVLTGCSGMGGCEFALKKAGIPHEIIGFMEIDKYAIQCYKQNHTTIVSYPPFGNEMKESIYNYGDITKIVAEELPDFDLFACGFPCQSFSIAGKRGGFEDTRGTIIYDILRIASVKKPKYMLLENVKGLLSHNRGATWDTIKQSIQKLGYSIRYKVLNSKDFGVPQNRERIWILCQRDGFTPFMEVFPREEKLNINVKDILEDNVDKKYDLSKKNIELLKNIPEGDFIGDFRLDEGIRVREDWVSPCLSARARQDIYGMPILKVPSATNNGYEIARPGDCIRMSHIGSKTGRGRVGKKQSQALTCGGDMHYFNGFKIRRLTPLECTKLMGFETDEINLEGISDTQIYKLIGNGWDVNLVSKIFKSWLKEFGE